MGLSNPVEPPRTAMPPSTPSFTGCPSREQAAAEYQTVIAQKARDAERQLEQVLTLAPDVEIDPLGRRPRDRAAASGQMIDAAPRDFGPCLTCCLGLNRPAKEPNARAKGTRAQSARRGGHATPAQVAEFFRQAIAVIDMLNRKTLGTSRSRGR